MPIQKALNYLRKVILQWFGMVQEAAGFQKQIWVQLAQLQQLLNLFYLILTIFVKLSLSTGARLETIRAIKRKDINLQEQTVTLVDLKGKAAGKDNATYLGFLNPNIISELSEFIKGLKPNAYIFQYENGNRVGVDYIQNNLQKLFDQLFNEHLKDSDGKIRDRKNKAVIHTLRHTFATHLAKENTPIVKFALAIGGN